MSHTVTITRLPDEQSDDVEYTIGGEHDAHCETYRECDKAWHRHPKNADIVGDEWGNDRVGEHRYIEGMWMTHEPNGCGLNYAFEEYTDDDLIEAGLGTHDVTVTWDGDWWIMSLVSKAVAA